MWQVEEIVLDDGRYVYYKIGKVDKSVKIYRSIYLHIVDHNINQLCSEFNKRLFNVLLQYPRTCEPRLSYIVESNYWRILVH